MKIDLHIITPQWGSGTTHRWEKEFGLRGIGIARHRLKEKMTIKVGRDIYGVTRDDIMDFMNSHLNSRFNAKGIVLYVIPIAIMTLIKKGEIKTPKKEEVKKDYQLTLF